MAGHQESGSLIQGHVVLYARDVRWRRAVARSLREAGHSLAEADDAEALRRLLVGQRFDVLALSVRDEEEASAIAEVLDDMTLPVHTVLLGSASALPLTLRGRRGGTVRFAPGRLLPRELGRLIDVTISSGTWDEAAVENGGDLELEELDLEEIVESAASAVYSQARRRRHRFHTAIGGPTTQVFGDRMKLREAFVALLRLNMALAPQGALISVEAEARRDDWLIRIGAGNRRRTGARLARVADALREETRTLTAASRALKAQGGMLWVELLGAAGPAFSMTLPLPPEGVRGASA